MPAPIIFLDFDGVLNTNRKLTSLRCQSLPIMDNYCYLFDPEAVANLKTIIDATNAEIVVSSSWRCEGIDFLREMWGDRNMPGPITGVTPRYGATYGLENRRGWEIEKYLAMLRQSENTQRKYVIIDDYDSFLPHQQEFFIHTDSDVGITEADAEKAIKILTMK